jgi:hypothetical protein
MKKCITISTTRKLGRRGFVLLAGAQTLTQTRANPVSGVLGVMCESIMKKYHLIALVILGLTLAPTVFIGYKGVSYLSKLEGKEVAIGYRDFADKVQSGTLSNAEIASRINKIASGEEKIAEGFGLLKISLYYWLVVIVAITALQAYLLRALLMSHNQLSQQDAASGAAA